MRRYEPTAAAIAGQAIRRERKAAGLSQAALAERIGVAQPTIVRWEDGTRAPDVNALSAVAEALGVSAADLLTDQPSRPRLNGWPQVVDFRGTAMRIVQMETGSIDRTLCMTCGTNEHRQTVTLKLVDEADFEQQNHILPGMVTVRGDEEAGDEA